MRYCDDDGGHLVYGPLKRVRTGTDLHGKRIVELLCPRHATRTPR